MEEFFQNSSSIDLIMVEELLLHRYTNINYIMELEICEGIDFINMAIEKNDDERVFSMWKVQLPFMGKDNYVSFEDYKARLSGKMVTTKSVEEILKEAEEIERMARGGGE